MRPLAYSLLVVTVLVAGSFNSCTESLTKQDNTERIAEIDSSLEAVYGMLNRAGTTMGQPDAIMIIYILRQHFSLNFEFPPIPTFYEKRPYLLDRYFKLYDQYFDGKFYVNYSDEDVWLYLEEELETDINAMTFWSMYCNKFPLDERFIKAIKQKLLNPPPYPDLENKSIPPPEYWALHAALQLQNAKISDCSLESKDQEQVWNEVMLQIENIAKDSITTKQYDLDIKTEALAMLFYTENDAKVSENDIEKLLSHQLKGGGWSFSTGSENVSLHTSVLAMWVLLEYKESLQSSLKS